jgi:hypothetical protein
MFNNFLITSPLFLGILAATSDVAQIAHAAESDLPRAEASGINVYVLESGQSSTTSNATLRIANATDHDLTFLARSNDPAWVNLHAGGRVVPGRIFVETLSSESNWPAEVPLDVEMHLPPAGSWTIHVRFRLSDLQDSWRESPFIEVSGRHGDQAMHASVPLAAPASQVHMEGYPWNGG